ncbi:MAG: hypothetical protein IIY07_02470, partial [Thermoguttaceae bacterium]|nr:hypothetical protein [Thermoguttaceae bacterium]
MKKTNENAVTRRQFVQSGAAALGAWAVVPYFAGVRAKTVAEQAPSDRLRVAAIGVGPMGYGDLCGFNTLADVVA